MIENTALFALRNGTFYTEEAYVKAVQAATKEFIAVLKYKLSVALTDDDIQVCRGLVDSWDGEYDTNLDYDLTALFVRHERRVDDNRVCVPEGVAYPQLMRDEWGSEALVCDPSSYKYWFKQGLKPVMALRV